MALISASKLSKFYGAQSVFQDVSVQIDEGKHIALVGVNGAGKTTLLRILAGLEEADTGAVSRARSLRIGYLPQEALFESKQALHAEMLEAFSDLLALQEELRAVEARLAQAGEAMDSVMAEYAAISQRFEDAGGYTYETEIARVLAGLGFGRDDWDKPIAIMSGGEKTRAALAKLLLAHPELLLLDEPTNHLDLAATEWLEDYLVHWPAAMVVVSHDRRFMDTVAQEVWDMAQGRIEDYPGNYSDYTRLRAERMERRRAEYETQQEQIAATEEFVRRYGAGQRSKEAKGRAKRLARLERLGRPQETEAIHLRLGAAARGGDHVLTARGLAAGYGAETLVTCPDLLIQRGERVALIGPNGCGKTTLLKTILGEIAPLAGEVRLGSNVYPAFYSQTHEGLNPDATVLEEVLDYDPNYERARSFLGRFLFSGDDVFKRVSQLSGGERSRVALARLTMEKANLLLLDEPTNHLDVLSQEVLEEVLSEFAGTILFVSHDRYLIDALATHVWAVENGRLALYEGNYSDHLEEKALRVQRAAERTKAATARRVEKGKPAGQQAAPSGRPSARWEREQQARLGAVEERIAGLERQLAELNDQMTVAGQAGDSQRVWEISRAYQAVEEDLARALADWGTGSGVGNMYLIGLTGNIATGKTTVCTMLRKLGAHIIDADALVHRLLGKGQPVYHQVVAAFGPDILTPTGDIDRPRLGRIVFADPQALQRLEAIVHPAVDVLVSAEVASATEEVVVIDAIKLIESGLGRRCNALWVVTAPFEQQMERLVHKRGMTEQDARQRILAQPPQDEKTKLADVVIRNDGSEAETEAQVRRAWRRMRRARRA